MLSGCRVDAGRGGRLLGGRLTAAEPRRRRTSATAWRRRGNRGGRVGESWLALRQRRHNEGLQHRLPRKTVAIN